MGRSLNAAPELGKLLVSDIITGHVVRTLEPIWPTVNAKRLRGRVEAVLDLSRGRQPGTLARQFGQAVTEAVKVATDPTLRRFAVC
jgi:hypothetical protein